MCARRFESRVHRIVPSLEQRIHDTASRARHSTALEYCYWYFCLRFLQGYSYTECRPHLCPPPSWQSLRQEKAFIDLLQRIEASRTTRLLVALIISSTQSTPFGFLCAAGAGEEERENTVQALCCVFMDMGKSWLQAEDDSIRRLLSSRRTKSEWIRREDGEPRACRVARWARRFGTRMLVNRENVRAGDPG